MLKTVKLVPVIAALALLAVACSPRESSPYPLPASGLNLIWDTTYAPAEVGVGVRWVQSASPVDGYIVERAEPPFSDYARIAGLSGEREGYLDTGVTSGTTYRYRIWTVMGDYMVLDTNPATPDREFTAP